MAAVKKKKNVGGYGRGLARPATDRKALEEVPVEMTREAAGGSG